MNITSELGHVVPYPVRPCSKLLINKFSPFCKKDVPLNFGIITTWNFTGTKPRLIFQGYWCFHFITKALSFRLLLQRVSLGPEIAYLQWFCHFCQLKQWSFPTRYDSLKSRSYRRIWRNQLDAGSRLQLCKEETAMLGVKEMKTWWSSLDENEKIFERTSVGED